MKFSKTGIVSLICVLVLCLSACAPRGETRTLAEILSGAQTRFAASYSGSGLPADAQEELDGLNAALKDFLKAGSHPSAAKVIEQMSQLSKSAGYTSRPAFDELLKQYEAIANGKGKTADAQASPQIKLLVARTYNLLARELETTRFQL